MKTIGTELDEQVCQNSTPTKTPAAPTTENPSAIGHRFISIPLPARGIDHRSAWPIYDDGSRRRW